MSLCVSFPKRRSSTAKEDLLVLEPATRATAQDSGRIVVRMKPTDIVGRWDYEAHGITVFFSGSLTSVPETFHQGVGSDSARTLGLLYAQYATQVFSKVDGAFCAVILDWRRRTIIVARDKLGIGRTYVSREDDHITFSDSLADLLEVEGRSFELDLDSVYAFLSIGWIPTPHSMFSGIEKFPAGSLLESREDDLEQKKYYDVPHSPLSVKNRSAKELSQSITEHLDRSVDRGLAMGGRWGSFLSGGVDSSSVVASLARTVNGSFATYFGGFSAQLNRYLPNPEDPLMSRLVAEHVGANHHMLWLGPETLETMPEIITVLEEPVCDGGCIVLDAVMRAARNDVDGLMTGIGGDFLFTGERRHMVLNLLRFMRLVPDKVWKLLNYILGFPLLARSTRLSQMHFDLTRVLAIRKLSIEAMYAGFFLQAEPSEMRRLFLPEVYAKLKRNPLQEMNDDFSVSASSDPLSRFLYLDLKHQTPEHCLREAETLGRRYGLKIYSPFLDADFVNFAMSVPSADKVSGLNLKVPLKEAMRGRVPDVVLDRKKGGLGSPIRWWVTQPEGLVASALSRQRIERRGFFSPETIEQFREATANGTHDYTKLLWSLFTLEIWLQQFVDKKVTARTVG